VALRDLAGRVGLVTGSSRGLGRAIAVRLGREGMRLALVARSAEELHETAVAVHEAGGEALVLPTDLRDADAAQRAVARTVEHFGSLDTVVNNAAIGAFWRLDALDTAAFDDVVAVNLRAAFAIIVAALPHLRLAGSGRILNVASRAAQEGYPYLVPYSASKHGLLGLSEAVDAELEDTSIRCHTLIVGSIDTPFHAAAFAGADPGLLPAILDGAAAGPSPPDPVGMLDPADVAEVVAFLLRLPDAIHVQPLVIRPSHDTGPADFGRLVRRGRRRLEGEGAGS
jgi:NAD(P)-dependent dehydrogenase (short-subunit alcohol dehydrogenase family)